MADPEQAELELGGETVEPGSEEVAPEVEEPEVSPKEELDELETAQAQAAEEREKRIRLEERLAAKSVEPPPLKEEPKKEFSRAQLTAAVNEGTIDEDQKEEIWATQQRDAHRRDTEELIEKREKTATQSGRVESDMEKYIASYPDVKDVTSENWKRVKTEYDWLISIGNTDSKATELAALRVVFGSPDKVVERTASRRQTSQETSSSSAGGGSGPSDDIFMKVPPNLRSHYRRLHEEGYKSLDEIKRELPFMRQQ